jgi:hypothetical protein
VIVLGLFTAVVTEARKTRKGRLITALMTSFIYRILEVIRSVIIRPASINPPPCASAPVAARALARSLRRTPPHIELAPEQPTKFVFLTDQSCRERKTASYLSFDLPISSNIIRPVTPKLISRSSHSPSYACREEIGSDQRF